MCRGLCRILRRGRGDIFVYLSDFWYVSSVNFVSLWGGKVKSENINFQQKREGGLDPPIHTRLTYCEICINKKTLYIEKFLYKVMYLHMQL